MFGDLLHHIVAVLGVAHLAAAKDADHLDLVSGFEESFALIEAVAEIVGIDSRTHTEFLQLRTGLLDPGLLISLARIVLELAKVQNLAHRRPRGGRDFYEIQASVLSSAHGIVGVDDPHLFAVLIDESDLGDADLSVAAVVVGSHSAPFFRVGELGARDMRRPFLEWRPPE